MTVVPNSKGGRRKRKAGAAASLGNRRLPGGGRGDPPLPPLLGTGGIQRAAPHFRVDIGEDSENIAAMITHAPIAATYFWLFR
ncbi:hypothetical protein C7449_101259 [Mycoplana dimorpha]|uniref:Uncharacterized protein n=1 Tax=Mycoplana dimorpha TaxID=28320 RepID=A0A2T5BHX8_MYCDI|nr:hypothetical protein C7449_101259 [Mycoplana dimorpha]